MDDISPLFAFHAQQAIGRGQLRDAVELCANGISQFPDYLSGYIVLARAYDALGMKTDARLIRTAAAERFVGLTALPSDPSDVSDQSDQSDVSDVSDVSDQSDQSAVSDQSDASDASDVSDVSAAAAPPPVLPSAGHSMQSLRLVTAAPATEGRVIRAASVRLIPGLEFTSLRFEGAKTRGRRIIQHLIEPPPFRTFHAPMKPSRPFGQGAPSKAAAAADAKRPLSLEELAGRLERARMPRPADIAKAPSAEVDVATSSSLVTDTIAGIYLAQAAYEKALDAYRQLQAANPDRHEHYQVRIDEVLRRMTP